MAASPSRGATSAVARRAFGQARVQTGSFALLFAVMAYAQAAGYEASFPTLRDRMQFAETFADNMALRTLYGTPHDLLSTGGYTAWRVGGVLSIVAAAWALLAAIRALRGEEDSGRQELVLAGVAGRRGAYLAAVAAIAAGAAVLWLATFLGLVAGGLDAGGSAYLALAIVSPTPLFAGIGALAAQLAPARRPATMMAGGVLALAFATRVIADTADDLSWLRWASPLGWVEELQAFADPRPEVLALPLISGAALLVLAGAIALHRDVGSGLLRARDRSQPGLGLLSSPAALALRGERGVLAAWLAGIGTFAFIIGSLATAVAGAGLSDDLEQELQKVGGDAITTPAGYIGLTFLFFVLALSLFTCSQIAAARREEAEGRLETLFALPFGRRGWLGGRLALMAAATAVLALAAGALAWAGAAAAHADVPLVQMLEAGANCLPAALLFGAFGALALAVTRARAPPSPTASSPSRSSGSCSERCSAPPDGRSACLPSTMSACCPPSRFAPSKRSPCSPSPRSPRSPPDGRSGAGTSAPHDRGLGGAASLRGSDARPDPRVWSALITGRSEPVPDDFLADRADVSAESGSPASRDSTAVARAGAAERRDEAARLRDAEALARDRAIEAGDRAAELREAELPGPAGPAATVAALKRTAATLRAQASSERARTASDRAQAAEDRDSAAADRDSAADDRQQAHAALRRAHLDELTGVYSRDFGLLVLGHEIRRAHRSGEPFVLAFIDVDGLKRTNDAHGHAAGDALLHAVGSELRSKLRSYDPIVRVGGDEFLCAFTNTGLQAAGRRIEEVGSALGRDPVGGSISCGMAELGDGENLAQLMARSDSSLYRLKQRA